MRLYKLLFGHRGASIYAVLVFVSGAVLTLSMPWASRLSELILQPWRPFPFAFFLAYLVLSALISLSIGAVSAPIDKSKRATNSLKIILVQVAFGQFLMLPLAAYSRVLFPGSVSPLIGGVVYVFLHNVMVALVAALMEVRAAARGKHSSVSRYGSLLLYCLLPLIGLLSPSAFLRTFALISPLYSLSRILSELSTALDLLLIFAIPSLLALGAITSLLRLPRKKDAV